MNNIIVEDKAKASNLKDLLNPFELDHFVQEYWDKKSLHVERNNPDFYNSLFSIKQVDELLASKNLTSKHVKVVKSQKFLTRNRYENVDKSIYLNQLYTHYVSGHTIILNEMDLFWNPIKALCRSLSTSISCSTNANMFFSPKDSQGLFPHFDTCDNYVLQIQGKKYWTLYDAPIETPITNSPQLTFSKEQLNNPKAITLKAGDMMYIPRGIPHEAFTKDESSLHISICVYPTQWIELLNISIKQLAHTDKVLRGSLPFGYLNSENWTEDSAKKFNAKFQEILQEGIKKANLNQGMIALSEENRMKQAVLTDGHFSELDKIGNLSLESRLKKREGMNCKVQVAGNYCRIIFPGNVIKGAILIKEASRFIVDSNYPFLLKDLPSMSDANKIKFAAQLIRGGLLRFAD